jgi:hypothetical protein
MDKVTYFTDNLTETEFAIIDNGDGSFTSMHKAEYDRQQAEQSTPIVTNEAKIK